MIEFTPVPAPDLKLEWFGDLEVDLTDDYLIKGVLANGACSVLFGPSNSGKTFYALWLAYHVAAGTNWNGRRVRQAAVLYLAAEGGRGIVNRIVAIRDQHRAAEPDAPDVPFALRRGPIKLLAGKGDADDVSLVVDMARKVQEQSGCERLLIVIDTLSRAMAGADENGAADMTQFVANIDTIRQETGAHVLIVHHTGKDVTRGARGHSSLKAALDSEIEVEAQAGGGHAAMVQKQRDYAGGEVFGFTLRQVVLGKDQDGDDFTTCVVGPPLEEREAGPKNPGGRPKTSDEAAYTAMEQIIQAVDMAEAAGYPLTQSGLDEKQFAVGQKSVRLLVKRAIEDGRLTVVGTKKGGDLLGVPHS